AQTAVTLVPRFASTTNVELALEFAAWLHSAIDPNRTEWTRAVYGALGALDEGSACLALIEALGGDEKGLHDAAWSALRKISGLSLRADRQCWEAWFEAESTWFSTTRPVQRAKLASQDATEVVAALRSYSERRLFKSTLASDLLPMLDRPEVSLRELACQVLARLGSRAAVRGLLDF